uniref:Transmembrane protein n=1 Tax=Craspedostauros australis TaxID=1486917 RepID=A0A7R9ZJR3_9STRA
MMMTTTTTMPTMARIQQIPCLLSLLLAVVLLLARPSATNAWVQPNSGPARILGAASCHSDAQRSLRNPSTTLWSAPTDEDTVGNSTATTMQPVLATQQQQQTDERNDLGWFLRGMLWNAPSSSSSLSSGDDDRNQKGSASTPFAVGSFVVAKADIPSLGIWTDQAYELREVYIQSTNEDGTVQRMALDGIDEASSNQGKQYIRLYSPMYHKETGPVIVTPAEVGLVSFRQEVRDSILFALPVLAFWLSVSYTFATKYMERSGGSLMDAFLGK